MTMATTQPEIKQRSRNDPTYDVDPGKGWILFAGTMIAVAGVINLIYGIAAISNATFYDHGLKFVIADLKTWGWIMTIVAVAQIAVSYGIFTEREWGRWGGIGVAGINMIVEFLAVSSHPVLAIMLFFVDVIVIWGLIMYGGRDRYNLAG
jgi:magnesium-transporting ATPase (P-type)